MFTIKYTAPVYLVPVLCAGGNKKKVEKTTLIKLISSGQSLVVSLQSCVLVLLIIRLRVILVFSALSCCCIKVRCLRLLGKDLLITHDPVHLDSGCYCGE